MGFLLLIFNITFNSVKKEGKACGRNQTDINIRNIEFLSKQRSLGSIGQ